MVGICGDGSTLMRLGELETFARYKVAVPLVIINDGALGTMKQRQKERGLAKYTLDLTLVDFAAIAKGFGLEGVTVSTPEAYEEELVKALERTEVCTVIDCRIDKEAYWGSFAPMRGGQYAKDGGSGF